MKDEYEIKTEKTYQEQEKGMEKGRKAREKERGTGEGADRDIPG